jgi:TM2 domain-containing membrane protein YozV
VNTKVSLFAIFLFLFFKPSLAQLQISNEIQFANYLSARHQNRDALKILNQSFPYSISQLQFDSLAYLKGLNYFEIKELDSSIIQFSKVSTISYSMFQQANFKAYFNHAYLRNIKESNQHLNLLQSQKMDSAAIQLKQLCAASNALFARNYSKFDSLANHFNNNYYYLTEPQQSLITYSKQMKAFPKKSPALAAIFSAIVPGSGKLYAGQQTKAITSFIYTAMLVGSTVEAYYRKGPQNANFIVLCSLSSLFYLGNIYGGYWAVKKKQKLFYEEKYQNILFDTNLAIKGYSE